MLEVWGSVDSVLTVVDGDEEGVIPSSGHDPASGDSLILSITVMNDDGDEVVVEVRCQSSR